VDSIENQLIDMRTRKSKHPMSFSDRDIVATMKRDTIKHQAGIISDVG